MRRLRLPLIATAVLLVIAAILARPIWIKNRIYVSPSSTTGLELIKNPKTSAEKIVNGAKIQAIDRVRYDAAYLTIPYPNGDVPKDQGACTDVVVRALRSAGYDLQKLIHEDMSAHFSLYPQKWGMRGPDSNIDHRRVPNHITFMKRFGRSLPLATEGEAAKTWKAGDLVYWTLTPSSLTHCGVISNERNAHGIPLVIHNIGPTARQEDCLNSWRIIGHFRYPR